MKHHLFVCVAVLLSFPLAADYETQADEWIKTYITHNKSTTISTSHCEALANLLYFSYLRSETSHKAHTLGLSILESNWHAWQNIIQTRLNPATPLPYRFDPYEQARCNEQWITLQKEYHHAAHGYVTITDAILKHSLITDESLQSGIRMLRTQARTAMAKALLDVQEHLNTFLKLSGKRVPEAVTRGINIKEFLMSYIPQLALKTFIEAEHASHSISEEGFNVLNTLQQVHAYVWQAVEKERAAFYKAHYKILCKRLNRTFRSMIGEYGILEESQRTNTLACL